jgi:hypothetical protein
MQCIDCRENEATTVWVQGTGVYTNVRRAGDPEERDPDEVATANGVASAEPGEVSEAGPRGPNVCELCAQRRYDARRGVNTPTWEEFRRRWG